MELVVAHNNMDFDALAAQYAVTKLHPSARMLPGYPLVGNLREFMSLYRDSLPLAQLKYIDTSKLTHLYIVDCQSLDRLDESIRALVTSGERTYTVFDHHDMDPNGLGPSARSDSIIESVGATTTILVEELKHRRIKLTPFEATLLAIGVYEDTGCLTYQGTGQRDAECVAYLLKHGADLKRINDYLHPKMSDAQAKLLDELMRNATAHDISGSKVVISCGQLPRYLDGLATLTRKLLDIESADAVFSVVKMRDRVHLVGRSDSPAVDVRLLLRHFGGDGHAGAGSAVARGKSVLEIVDEIEQLLRQQVKPETVAQEIMATPVRTIRSRTTMEEAGRLMLRYGLDGLVVAEGDQVVGIVSRRDIDQATHHRLSHAPVQGFMSHPVISISPQTPLSEIQRIMAKEDVGRLPVLDGNGRLLGMVSRREVMRTLHGADADDRPNLFITPSKRYAHFRHRLEELDPSTRWLFEQLGTLAAQLNMVAYAVGGVVRDMLLGLPNFDLDFVIEGSALDLARALEAAFPARLQVVAAHERFQTATLAFHAGVVREIDLSTARTEFYEYPAALPEVEASRLEQDLFRRDFTINALAIALNPGQYGDVIDYFGGLQDMEERIIRILHPFSFIEDPTRIVRAARFAARLGFKPDARTRQQAERAISLGIFDNLGGVRLRTELKLILESPQRVKALDLLGEWGGKLAYLDAELRWDAQSRSLLRRAERLLRRYQVEDEWVVYLGVLLSQLKSERCSGILDRLYLSNDQKEMVKRGLELPDQDWKFTKDMSRSDIYEALHGLADQSLAIAACAAAPGSPLRRVIKVYLEELKTVSVSISGQDLLRMGFPQGRLVGQVLSELLRAKLEGSIKSLRDEIAFVWAKMPVRGDQADATTPQADQNPAERHAAGRD